MIDREKYTADLIKKGYTRELERLIRTFVAPIYWYAPNNDAGKRVLNNGTMFFINTGERIIGITAWHVYHDGYELDFKRAPNIECALLDKRFDLIENYIDCDEAQDISTFSISDQYLAILNRSSHFPPSWPPEPPKAGEVPIICGFPGCLRIEHDTLIEWAHWIGILWADDPGLFHSSIVIDRKNIIEDPFIKTMPEGESIGGCSGGPLFAMEYEPIWKWRIAGLVSQGPNFVEGIYTKAICNVNLDGTIRRNIV